MFSKIFLGPFPGPSGLMPTTFEFPFVCYKPSYFFPTFLPNLFHHLTQSLPTLRNILNTPPGLTPTIFEFPFSCYITNQKPLYNSQ